jgi:hypothetical protein
MLKKIGMFVLALSAALAIVPAPVLAQENYRVAPRDYYYQSYPYTERYEARTWRERERQERRAEKWREHEAREWRRHNRWNRRYDPYCRTNSYYYGFGFRR